MILLVFKMCLTSFIIFVVSLVTVKFIEPEYDFEWNEKSEQFKKVYNILHNITISSLLTGVALFVVWLLVILWGL